MGERRKHRTFWSSEEETNCFQAEKERHSMHDDGKGFHLSRSTAQLAYADRSHWDPMNESHMDSRHGTREDRKRYYKSNSPRIDEMELHSYYNQTHEYDHRHSQRYSARARSRSGSRSRNRGRDRSRSRSLSRTRSNGNIRAHLNSRSPIVDYGLHQSHEWSEKRSNFDKSSSSQVCRHFAAGRCIRGSQCRYIHSVRMNRKDADVVNEDEHASEIWRNRADRDHNLGHSYDRGSRLFDVSESYRRENVQFSSRSRSDVPCKNFVRDKCQWGNNCRFSHHLRSDDFGRGTRNDFSDDANEHRPRHNWKAQCKFYAAGKCDRINCRFSHSEANFDNQESRFNDVSHVSHDQQNWWSGASERDLLSDPVNTNADGTVHVDNGQNEDYWGSRSMEREMTSLEITKVIDNSLNWEKKTSLTGESGSYYSRGGEFFTENDRVNEQEQDLLISSQMLENHNGAVNVYGQSLPVETSQQQHHSIYSSPKIPQKPKRLVDFKSTDYLHVSDVHDEVKDHPYPIPSKAEFTLPDLNQGGGNILSEKSILTGSYGEPSNHLNKSSSVMTAEESLPINFQSPIQNSQKVRGLSIMLEPKVSQCFPNSFSSEHSAQATNCALTTTGQVEISSPLEKMPSFPDISVSMPLVNMTTLQHKLASALLDLSNSTKDIAINTERENHETTWGVDKNSETPIAAPPSSSPVVGMEPDTSIVKLQDSPKLKQKEELVANHEIVKETEGTEENKDRGKVEEGVADKDDRGLRMFKYALVEFVKETLKPTWKEGRMSREAHKNVVKKVVDKVCSSIQDDQIPRTRERIEHYLSYSKPKVAKLVQAYVERCRKAES